MKKIIAYFLGGAALFFSFAGIGYAETTVSAEVQYIFNTLLFLMSGFLVIKLNINTKYSIKLLLILLTFLT